MALGTFAFTLGADAEMSATCHPVPTTAQLVALNPAPVLFDRVNVLTFEKRHAEGQVRRLGVAPDLLGAFDGQPSAPRATARS